MPVRSSNAAWEGGLKGGKGTVALGSGAFQGPYSFGSRFEDGSGTNPEELIAAAHAGCFSMALAAGLERAGHSPEKVATTARVHLDKQDAGFAITAIDLDCEAEVPGLANDEFQTHARQAKEGCPVSKALAAVEIRLEARLVR
jgi:osmotically inducible protein OsmC